MAEIKAAPPKANPYAGMMPNEVLHNLTGGGAGTGRQTPKRGGGPPMKATTPNQLINTLTGNMAGAGMNAGGSS